MKELVERLAALEHEQWAHWTRYMLDHLTHGNIERWRRQCETPYDELSTIEKDSDREWAHRVIDVLKVLDVSDYLDLLNAIAGDIKDTIAAKKETPYPAGTRYGLARRSNLT